MDWRADEPSLQDAREARRLLNLGAGGEVALTSACESLKLGPANADNRVTGPRRSHPLDDAPVRWSDARGWTNWFVARIKRRRA